MKRVAVIGHFAFGKEFLDGQTVKTKIVTAELDRRLGEHEVLKLDTHGGKKKLLSLPAIIFGALKNCENVVILPAQNGLRIIAPLLVLENMLFHRKLHYAVIGGWLPKFLEKRPGLARVLKRIDCIYVETSTMKTALIKQGFGNVEIMPNCKDLTILAESELVYADREPYRLCTFSRVMKEKGIEDAVDAVRAVNEQYGRTVYTLDIYGPVASDQTEWFDQVRSAFPDYVKYGGLVPFDQSVTVIKDYFALLFPTRFFTEGVPGTIIDAYAAGVPVISSRWESFSDIVDEGVTGIGYEFGDGEGLKRVLLNLVEKPPIIVNMKSNCIAKALKFAPRMALNVLFQKIGEKTYVDKI